MLAAMIKMRKISEKFTIFIIAWAKFICRLNFAPACNLLGLMYKFGEGAQKDESKAQSYLKKACELGDKNSCEGKPSGY